MTLEQMVAYALEEVPDASYAQDAWRGSQTASMWPVLLSRLPIVAVACMNQISLQR